MSAVCHSVVVTRFLVKCMVVGEDEISCEMAGEGSVRKTKLAKTLFLKITTNTTGSSKDASEVGQEERAGRC